MSHFIKKCKHCKTVLAQCRCPSKDKEVMWGECDKCKSKLEEPDYKEEEELIKKIEKRFKMSLFDWDKDKLSLMEFILQCQKESQPTSWLDQKFDISSLIEDDDDEDDEYDKVLNTLHEMKDRKSKPLVEEDDTDKDDDEEVIECPMKTMNIFPWGDVPVVDMKKLKKMMKEREGEKC